MKVPMRSRAVKPKRVRLTDYERHLRDMENALLFLFAPTHRGRGRGKCR
jgi:hypothetical protein